MIGCDRVASERIRASLRRSPFLFLDSEEPHAADEVDLYVVSVGEIGALPSRGVPVIAWGPAALLRSAFLAGCGDYLKDPWSPEELGMRALAVLSRAQQHFLFPWGELSFQGKDLATPAGVVALTHHEFRVLRMLLQSRGTPVPRDALAYSLWGAPAPTRCRAHDVHVAAIRRKVRAVMPAAGPRFIEAVRREGYMVP